MQRALMTIFGLLLAVTSLQAQEKEITEDRWGIGLGYFGESFTHPGFVISGEYEHFTSERWSFPIRADFGYFRHKRYQDDLFLDINLAARWHSKGRFFMGAGFGFGPMWGWHNSDDGVWEIGDDGIPVEVSNYAGAYFNPNINFEFGLKTSEFGQLWFRPKVSWQLPVNERAMMHAAFQLGYTYYLH